MNTHDIELPKPFMTVYDDVDKVEVGCYSEIQVRAAIEADRKRRGAEVKAVVDDLRSHASMARWQAHSLSRLLDAVATQGAQKAATLTAAMSNLERMAMRLEDSADYIDTHAPQPAEPVDKSKNLQGSVVDKAEEMQGQPAEPVKLECPKCGAERSKVPCAGELMNCHFRGEAQSAEPSKQSEVREYLQQTLRTAADEACRLIANSDTPTKFEGIFGHRAEQLDYASAAKVCRSVGANSFAECFEQAAQHKAAKYDGNHGGPRCADPECWNDSSD